MTSVSAILKKPIVILLAICLVIGFFTFRDYGFTWDEPYFYGYADAVGYAYNPVNWFSGHFNLANAYGPSASDHMNRGPAYLLLAREPVYLIETFGIHTDDAWHLVNFLTFLLGIYFLYQICLRWISPWAAFFAASLFASQPILWGYAFINPKDMPFLVFFLGTVYLGFCLADHLKNPSFKPLLEVLIAGIFLGIATNIRVLGPLAGIMVLIYFFTQKPTRQAIGWILLYGLISIVTMLAMFPYLWQDTVRRLIETFISMSTNPISIFVLFNGIPYHADELPRRFFPTLLILTLTEPVWPLFALGLGVAIWRAFKRRVEWISAVLVLAWFVLLFADVVINPPPIYDGSYRRMIFILPPVFIFAGFAFNFLLEKINRHWINVLIGFAILAPGIFGILQLHPYEYTYYNSLIGGTAGAFRRYETDYWLTCYKQAVEEFNQIESQPTNLYVHREPEVAAPYAASNIKILDERGALDQIQTGDYILINTRANEDTKDFHGDPIVLSVGRAGATFCVIKEVTKTP